MNLAAADRASRLRVEPPRSHAKGRRRPGRAAGRRSCCARATVRRMRVLVTGGAGFIGSHFVKRLAAAGDDVVVLDKLDLLGQPGQPRGRRHRVRRRATSADPDARRRGRLPAATRSSTSPPRRTSTARSSRRATSSRRTSPATQVLLDWCARDRRTASSRSRPTRSTATSRRGGASRRGRPAAPVEPVQRRPRPAATCRSSPTSRTYGVDALDHARREHVRAEPVPGEARSRSSSRTRSTASRCRSTATAGSVRDWLYVEDHCAGDRARRSREGAPARSTTSAAARSARTCEIVRPDPRARPAPTSRSSATSRTAPGTTAATRSTRRSCAALGWEPQRSSRRASRARSPGTATTARGGSRSSPASTARTTSSQYAERLARC